ncbi:helix-turn-helix domain-containing protein [Paenibacillus radicis (ex Xue et al. 2023)]|uniref:ATP-binding protein n=1 Tax=Paenibacillus radicis (ex Xue et al. 2023) TaxID=2972489 RepID=A0ABT1YJX1_9BACL|nr:ATP-binding protein [Paenibacillus radicis (ex Xue et al. 2023)]MCR8633472.1 ATP-binding protein [Paenibacillus radicis (ex Xue et al. 2023)]
MNNADLLFEKFQLEGYDLIEKMINEKQEEHLFLDFKEKSDSSRPGLSDDDKRNYAKALSGFSNSSGGIIVWGVSTKREKDQPDAASEKKPISHLKKMLTDLNSLISDALIPTNNGIQNIFLVIPGETDVGFIITYVPESDLPPHRAMLKVNNYITRVGDSFLIMEHHMLADTFGRRQRPKLDVISRVEARGTILSNTVQLSLIIGIQNSGRYVANYPAIRVKGYRDIILSGYGVDGNRNWVLTPLKQTSISNQKYGYFFTGGVNDVIHPGTFIEVAIFERKSTFMSMTDFYSLSFTDNIFEIDYEIYAEACEPVKGKIEITLDEIINIMKTEGLSDVDHLKKNIEINQINRNKLLN